MAPLAAQRQAVPETGSGESPDGVKAVLLGPPGSGKGTMVRNLTPTNFEVIISKYFYRQLG